MRLIHLTDPHLSKLDGEKFLSLRGKRWSGYLSWRLKRRKWFLPAVLDRMTDSVKSENADLILLTGDLVQIGLETEITQATQWLTALGSAGQVMLVPGNHDIYAKDSAVAVYHAWSDYLFKSDQVGSHAGVGQFPVMRKFGKLNFIGLSTACVTPVFMASGTLGEQQLEQLADLLEQAASEDQMVCLLIHHPPLPGMTHWRKALSDAEALQSVLERYPPLLIFHGHLHHNRDMHWGDSRIYCTAAGSSASDASYRVIDIEDRDDCWSFKMVLKSVAIEPGGEPEFAAVDEQCWQIPKNSA